MRRPNLILSTLLVFGLGGSSACAAAETIVGDVRFTLQTKNGQRVFHIGELIPLKLGYSLMPASGKSYTISNNSYDRSGRLGIERFQVEPANGWDDPLQNYFQSYRAFIGGGFFSSAKLTSDPVVISRDLNEWVRFTVPGRYRLTVFSTRVQPADHITRSPSEEVRSNEISLTIIPATPEWQKRTLETAVIALGPPVFGKGRSIPVEGDERSQEAVAVLRYLGTPAAAVEMVNRLGDENRAFQFMLGLASTPAREAAFTKMQQLLQDPAFPVTGTFLQTLSLVALPPDLVSERAQRREHLQSRYEQELCRALPNKQGQALTISAYTILDAIGMRSGELPVEEKRQLTTLLINAFDHLPLSVQARLLQYRWQVLDPDIMKPLLPKIVERYTDPTNPQQTDAYETDQLSASALLHWWEIDPEGARPAIFREILRPKPRFGAEVLGILPDKTLPEVEQQLADHLVNGSGHEEQIASLLGRYATASVEPQIADYLQTRVGRLACKIQTPLLAYLLRVDVVGAAPFVQGAMTARGAGFSACNHSLLVEVANLHNDPLLQEVAIASLNDCDPEVAANAATYLGTYGTVVAEAPLWARLVAWSSEWKGREAELRYIPGETMEGTHQAGLGSNLITALGAGQGWLSNEGSLNRLLDLSVTPEQRNQVEQLMAASKQQPKQIQFVSVDTRDFQIAQYHANSIEAAVEKLKQFPSGTEFIWIGPLTQPNEQKAYQQLTSAVKSSGVTVKPSSPPN